MKFRKPNEIFRDIPEYEGLYQVSNYGNVKSLKRQRTFERILKSRKSKKGYLRINLHKNGKQKIKTTHRLVLLAFYGYSSLECNHKNGIKSDNTLWNLEYCTSSENKKHAYILGLRSNKGESHPGNTLKEKEVLEIRELYKYSCYNQYELAKIYSVTQQLISRIINRKSWKHI